jgi:hypothetical protein
MLKISIMYSKEIAGFQSLLKIYYVPITGA